MKEYRLNRSAYVDYEWFNMINRTEDYPPYNDMFDDQGEIKEEFADSFNVDIYVLAHDSIRISDLDTLKAFFRFEMINGVLAEEIIDMVENATGRAFQVAGDGDGLGFIVDIFEDEDMEELEETATFWFDDYE